MNNILGQPVEGDDFFNREEETGHLWRTLEEGNHILLLAPRRVGKTSLALRVGSTATKSGWKFVLVDVQGCMDELSFLDNLFEALKSVGVKVPVLARLIKWVTNARRNFPGKVEGGGFSVAIDPSEGQETTTLERQIERLFNEMEESGDRVLIAVDELPVLLQALEEGDKTDARLRRFLNWFRALRLRYRKNVRWLLLGSVGLDTFAEVRYLTSTINDLKPSSLGAYSEPTAISFLQELGKGKGVKMSKALCKVILSEIGWPLPFFLQLVFHELHSLLGRPSRQPQTKDAKKACDQLVVPEFYKHFEPWRGRLAEGLNAEHHQAATAVLKAICFHVDGLPRNRLLDALMMKFPQRQVDEVGRILATTLGQLERDGYLLRRDGSGGGADSYAFRSFLLRRYWHTREVA
jgi:uncharacterized protein